MPVPTYDELLRPLLELAANEDITRRSATEAMTKGGLIAKISPRTYRATDRGREFLARYPQAISINDLRDIPGWEEAWNTRQLRRESRETEGKSANPLESSTPEERIEDAFSELRDTLITDLLAKLANTDPFRFEQVVLDLLVAMGYGGSRKEAAEVTQKTGDEGIDGVINEDRLGLDVIYVQAKRWKANVGRPEIQSFVGALAGKKANKGIFITTSGFHDNASEYAAGLHNKVILIDGRRLAELMIEHGIGVSEEHAYSVKKIDSDYFDEA
jgi:restriction system protein